jgi:cation transport ATPase
MSADYAARLFRKALIAIAVGALAAGLIAWAEGRADLAGWIWAAGTAPVALGLLVSMIRDFLAGRAGVDAVAFVSMSASLALGENLAGIVVAVMYAGGHGLEDFAVARAAQTAKAPFIRLADRYALLLLPLTLIVAGAAWFFSGDPVRGLAVLVAATPCPLILAAPVAFIAGIAQAARNGILIKGGRPLEALARAHTVMFDKTGTLTVGGRP